MVFLCNLRDIIIHPFIKLVLSDWPAPRTSEGAKNASNLRVHLLVGKIDMQINSSNPCVNAVIEMYMMCVRTQGRKGVCVR